MSKTEEVGSTLTRAWGLLIGIFAGLVVFVFYLLGNFEIGKFAGFSTAAIMCAVRIEWDYREERWFWPFTIGTIILHSAILYFITFIDENYPVFIFSPIFILDIFLIVWGMEGLHKRFDSIKG